MYKVRVSYATPRKFRVRYREEGADDITIITTINGLFSITVAGAGDIVINWGDGVLETVTLNGVLTAYSHNYTDGGRITIKDASGLEYLVSMGMQITRCDIRDSCTAIRGIVLTNNLLTYFHTYASWVNLEVLTLTLNSLTSINTYPQWTALTRLVLSTCNLSSVDLYEEWVNLEILDLFTNNITSVDLYDSWINLQQLNLANNLLTSVTLHPEWVLLTYLSLSYNSLTNLTVYGEWVDLQSFYAQANALNEVSINQIMTELEPVIATETDSLWVDIDTNAPPTGAGLVSANNMLATLADVRWNTNAITFDMTTITWDSTAVTWDNM